MEIKDRLLAVLDWFGCRHYSNDINGLYRSRLLVANLLADIPLMLLFAAYLRFVAQVSPDSRDAALLLVTPVVLVEILLLVVMRRFAALAFCSHALLLVSALGVFASIYLSGGLAESPAAPMLLLPMILGFCLTGLAGGIFWALVSMLAQFTFFALLLRGYRFPQLADSFMQFHLVFSSIVTFSNAAVVLLVYEHINRKLSDELRSEKEIFAHLAHHDGLTGLFNRARFDEEIERAVLRARRSGERFALLYLDLDDFKPVNDTYGHEAGDEVLREISQRLLAHVRRTDVVARLGGDEFAIIIDQVKDNADVIRLANILLSRIEDPITRVQQAPRVTGSIGIAIMPDHAADAGSLVRLADRAMYQAKHSRASWAIPG